MFLDFIVNETETKKYEIIRDYFVSVGTGSVQGIYFIVKEIDGTEIKKVFLNQDDINNEFVPRKVDEEDAKVKASGVEIGEENLLIIEKGIWKKKGLLNKEQEIPAKLYRFILKK